MRHPFHEEELKVAEISKAFRDAQVPIYNYPVPMKDAWRQMAL